jgi:putative two-component system response regulator
MTLIEYTLGLPVWQVTCIGPGNIRGGEIPLVGRIVTLADVFDALTHARPYKAGCPVQEALAEIERQSGHQFDPRVAATFLANHAQCAI